MRSISAFLSYLSDLDIKLSLDGDRLRCNAPEGTITPELKAELATRKAEIITFLREYQKNKPTSQPIKVVPRHEPIPLSFAQQRLWFLQEYEASGVYNMAGALQMQGELNLSVLEKSMTEIVRRHEILRTSFENVKGVALQQINTISDLSIPVIDLQNLSQREQSVQIQDLAKRAGQTLFDLSQSPLIRFKILKLAEKSHILLVTMHHIVSDGWSISVFTKELSALYEAFCQGNSSPLPPLSIQYADFAYWQREWLQGKVLDTQLSYWKKQLAGIPPLLELPTDHPRPSLQSFRGRTLHFSLPAELSEKLGQISLKFGISLFMTLLGSLATLLYRYTHQEDIVIGSPIANRNRTEIEPLIGFFVNTLVLRTTFTEQATFTEILQQVRQTTLDAYAHQDLPFEKLVEALQPDRNTSYSPLFQVMFSLENTGDESFELKGLTVTPLKIDNEIAKFDLTLALKETPNGLTGIWEYNTDLFKDSTVERMNGHFQTLLESVVNHPEEKIAYLPILTPQEQHLLLGEWNQTLGEYPAQPCVHQLFEQQVSQTPQAIALSFENEHLTYQQLNEQANQLAHYLQSLGVKPETLVGLCIERSLDLVIAILAILKAGGAYLPLDPIYPPERLAFMVEDSQSPLLLTQSSLREKLPQQGVQILELDHSREIIATYSRENPPTQVTPDNLIYIIYTSGSTGKPKGVLINHYNVTRLLTATEPWYHFSSEDVWTLFHSYAFDFSVWEIWGALAYGGKLVIVPYWVSRSSEDFYQLLKQEKVTVLNQTPSAFRQLIPMAVKGGNHQDLSLKWVIFGGEALDIPSLKPWFDYFGDEKPQLVNMYGITETTVHVTYRPLTRADLNSRGSVIGTAIPDLEIYILDEYQQLSPIGIGGEMCIGGAGLARGYLNREDLNEQKFISNPLKKESGGRLYRSGDLARYLESGELEYLGRIDHQVKIRGFRLELGEIEALLNTHPEVRESLVIVREEKAGEKQLVAYIVSTMTPEALPYQISCEIETYNQIFNLETESFSHQGVVIKGNSVPLTQQQKLRLKLTLPHRSQPQWIQGWVKETQPRLEIEFNLSTSEKEEVNQSFQKLLENSEFLKVEQRNFNKTLRSYLQEKLPDYMIPSIFVLLEKFPLTPNGKIDRKALPAPDWSTHSSSEWIPPRNSTEEMLVKIWSEVLKLERVGIYDHFFELGGHSLLATQVISRLRDVFQIDIPLKSLFERPILADLAEFIVLKQLEQTDDILLAEILAQVDELSDEEVKQQLQEL